MSEVIFERIVYVREPDDNLIEIANELRDEAQA